MPKKIVIIQGHPDSKAKHFGHALAKAYEDAAKAAGHSVRTINVASLDFPLLRSAKDWDTPPPPSVQRAQQNIQWAEHAVIVYPLWLGDMPALLKAFFEQLMRPGFAFRYSDKPGMPEKLLRGRSARVVVTMGMPGFLYKWYYHAHSLKSLEKNILAFVGFKPVSSSIIGSIEDAPSRESWLQEMAKLGRAAD